MGSASVVVTLKFEEEQERRIVTSPEVRATKAGGSAAGDVVPAAAILDATSLDALAWLVSCEISAPIDMDLAAGADLAGAARGRPQLPRGMAIRASVNRKRIVSVSAAA